MDAKAVSAVVLCVCAVGLAGCTSNAAGSFTTPLVPGVHTVTERSLRDGVWDWEASYQHDGVRTTGELQVFALEGSGPRLLDQVSIAPVSGGTAGTVEADGALEVQIVIEVSTADSGHITVEWEFHRR